MPRRFLLALAVTAGVTAAPVVAAPVPAAKPANSPVTKARAALDKPITAKGDAKSFTETIDLFKDLTKAEIALDVGTLQMMGMDANQPVVTFNLKGAKLKDALKEAFGPFNLRYGVTATGIVVSSDEGIIARQLREVVSVAADGQSLAAVLKGLAEQTGANVVIDPRAKKLADEAVTLRLDDVPLEVAVRLTAEIAGASVVRMSNVLFVTTEARADKLRPDADRPVGPVPVNPFFPGIDGGFGIPGGIGGPGGIAFPPPPVEAVPVPAVDPAVPPPAQKDERTGR